MNISIETKDFNESELVKLRMAVQTIKHVFEMNEFWRLIIHADFSGEESFFGYLDNEGIVDYIQANEIIISERYFRFDKIEKLNFVQLSGLIIFEWLCEIGFKFEFMNRKTRIYSVPFMFKSIFVNMASEIYSINGKEKITFWSGLKNVLRIRNKRRRF